MSSLRLENFNGSLSTHKPQHSTHHPDTAMEIRGVYVRAHAPVRMNVAGGRGICTSFLDRSERYLKGPFQ